MYPPVSRYGPVRFVFLCLLVLNLGLVAFGQGLFGTVPSDRGRDAVVLAQRNAQMLRLEPAQMDAVAPSR